MLRSDATAPEGHVVVILGHIALVVAVLMTGLSFKTLDQISIDSHGSKITRPVTHAPEP